MSEPDADFSYGILPEHLKYISLRADSIRARGCTWIVNGDYCKMPCAPFIFVCHEHKDIPDFPRHIYATSSTCQRRKSHIKDQT